MNLYITHIHYYKVLITYKGIKTGVGKFKDSIIMHITRMYYTVIITNSKVALT